ncbi:uncharacterized protein OCT59_011463 [Rhizophagus irregularis]|uniref:uncharacterized protein n=1 Tax=Rhizophagus irregularis TaxID=588596 RepID=UPI003333A322|nr:hypothetical protein OCT59_011463 [Rhizophagus irregularis]
MLTIFRFSFILGFQLSGFRMSGWNFEGFSDIWMEFRRFSTFRFPYVWMEFQRFSTSRTVFQSPERKGRYGSQTPFEDGRFFDIWMTSRKFSDQPSCLLTRVFGYINGNMANIWYARFWYRSYRSNLKVKNSKFRMIYYRY